MVVKDQTIEIFQGNRRVLTFTVMNEETGLAKDLTNHRIQFAVAATNDEGIPLKTSPKIDLNTDDDPTQVFITDALNGVVTVTLEEADTATLPPVTYYFETEVVDPAGNSLVVATGSFTVELNVDNA